MTQVQQLIDLSQNIREKQVQYSSLMWTYYTTGFEFEMKKARDLMMNIYKDESNFNLIRSFREKDLSREDKRRVDILFNVFKPFHLNNELNEVNDRIFEIKSKLSGILNRHRVKLDGKETSTTDISSIISKSDDRKLREKAWRSKSQINKSLVDGGFIELQKLRQEYAKLFGAEDFVSCSLEVSELDKNIFDGWKKQAVETLPATKKAQIDYAKKYLGHEDFMPWDAAYLKSKINPIRNTEVDMMNFVQPIRKIFNSFGFDIDRKNITFDIFPRKNKSEWGYNFTIDYGKDTRVLANVSNEFYHFWVLLHETGHAVHYGSVDPDDYIMNMGISGIISEGLANLFGDLMFHPSFYTPFFPNKLKEAESQFKAHDEWKKINAYTPVEDILFDHALLTDNLTSLDDINNLKLNYMKELGGIDIFNGEPPWAYLIHHTTHPVYLHNYFMGDVTCAMLKEVFKRNNNVENILDGPEKFGAFLQEKVISPSGLLPFGKLFRSISGEDFSLKWMGAHS